MKSFDAKTYSAPYSVVEKFTIKLSSAEKVIEMDTNGKALWMQVQASPPTPTYSVAKPFAGYAPTISLSSGASTDIEDLEIDFTQKITLFNPASGSPDWVTAYYGEREMSFKYTARFDNDTLYQKFLTNQTDSLHFNVKGGVASTTFNYEFDLNMPNIVYDSMEHDLGKDNVLIKAAGKAIVAGGSSLASAYLINLIASYN
jgi:hypothetical protein